MLGYKKGNIKELCGQMPLHYPADRVYLDGDTSKTVQGEYDKRVLDLSTNIISYTSSNKFDIPDDGYVFIYNASTTPSAIEVDSEGGRYIAISASSSCPYNSLFVKKGMKVFIESGTPNIARYFKLKA